MKGRGVLVGVLAIAIAANVLLALDTLTGARLLSSPGRKAEARVLQRDPHNPSKFADAQAREAEAAYRTLIAELTDQKTHLDRKALELTERERQIVVLRQELEAQAAQVAQAAAAQTRAAATATPPSSAADPVKRLVRTYSAMTPENAAQALTELHDRAPQTALDIFLALPPHASGSILDALSSTKPALAAQLSLEIVRRGQPVAD